MSSAENASSWGLRDALVHRPAASVAALFIVGIAAHDILPACGLAFALLALAAAAIGGCTFRRPRAGVALSAIVLAGIAAAQIEAFYFPSGDISSYATDQPRLARVELELDEPVRILTSAFNPGRQLPPRQVTNASVVRVLTTSGWVDTSGRTLVQIDPPNPELRIGQRIRALGMLQRPSPAMNPGQFDWAAYYREQRILTSIQLTHGGAMQILSATPASLMARMREGVRALLARGFTKEQSLDHALLRALVLGDNDPELRDVQEQFRRTGTSHHLAISGLHIAVLGGLIYWLCRRMMLRPRWMTAIAMAAVMLYGALALPSPPVLRSVILCAAFALGMILSRSIDPVQLLSLSVLALLVWHPLDLYNAGFQLSFGTVLGLMVLTRHVSPLFEDKDAEVVMNTPGGRPPMRLVIGYRIRKFITPPLAAGLVAWIVSMPLIAYHFDQLNPWGVISSLLLSIPVFLALTAGFLKIVLTLVLPFGATWWAWLAALPVALMRHCVDWLAMLPGSDVPLPAHSISFVVVYYVLVLSPLVMAKVLPTGLPRLRFGVKLAPGLAVMLLVLIPLSGGAASAPKGSLSVTALGIGAGQCCAIDLPDGRLILLDAGSATLQDPVRKCIAPYLRSRGRARIDELWLSDCDFDHMGAVVELMRVYDVGKIVMGNRFEHDAEGKPADELLLEQIRTQHLPVTRLGRGDRVDLGRGANVDVLWPPTSGSFGVSNNHDLVLKLTYARRTVLFPADVQQAAQSALLKSPTELRCDAMLAPHHGSGENATPAFIQAADPLYIVSSNDRTLTQKQKLFEKQVGARPLYRTNEHGATTITIDRNGGITVTPFVGE